MNNFPLNSINSKVFQNIMPKVMIILQSSLSIRVELFLKRKFWKKVHYYVSKVVFRISPSIFYPFINILQENAKSRQKKILFHYKETFSRMSEHTALQKQIKQVFFSVALHFLFISWRHRSEDNRKKRKNQKVRSPFC